MQPEVLLRVHEGPHQILMLNNMNPINIFAHFFFARSTWGERIMGWSCPSVCPHVSTRVALDGLWWDLELVFCYCLFPIRQYVTDAREKASLSTLRKQTLSRHLYKSVEGNVNLRTREYWVRIASDVVNERETGSDLEYWNWREIPPMRKHVLLAPAPKEIMCACAEPHSMFLWALLPDMSKSFLSSTPSFFYLQYCMLHRSACSMLYFVWVLAKLSSASCFRLCFSFGLLWYTALRAPADVHPLRLISD
jgi:hypothetical protein